MTFVNLQEISIPEQKAHTCTKVCEQQLEEITAMLIDQIKLHAAVLLFVCLVIVGTWRRHAQTETAETRPETCICFDCDALLLHTSHKPAHVLNVT